MTEEKKELIKQLKRQIKYLETSSKAYDWGDIDEALRIATALRVLFHDTKMSTSLFSHLGQKNKFYYISTLESIEEQKNMLLKEYGMTITQYDPPLMSVNGERKPPFDSWGHKKFFTFESWWNENILKLNDNTYTRKDIVLLSANKDGGAHVEFKLNEKTKLLKKGTGRITFKAGDNDVKKELTDTHFLFLRQIAYEVLSIEKVFTLNGLEFKEPICETITYSELLKEAGILLDNKKFEEAVRILITAITYDASKKEAYNYIGVAYEELNDMDEAIKNYSKSINIDKQYIDPQLNLANIYINQRKYDLALDYDESILLINPDEHKANRNRNYIISKLKEQEELLYQYNTFFEKSKNKTYLDLLSYGLFEKKEYEKALFVYERLLSLYGENSLLMSNIGVAYIRLKNYKRAKEYFYKIMKEKEVKEIGICLNVLEYLLVFEKEVGSKLMNQYLDYFKDRKEDMVLLDMFKILFDAVEDEYIDTKLVDFKNCNINNNIIYDFSDLIEMANFRNLNILKNTIECLCDFITSSKRGASGMDCYTK